MRGQEQRSGRACEFTYVALFRFDSPESGRQRVPAQMQSGGVSQTNLMTMTARLSILINANGCQQRGGLCELYG